jgi:tetratricopeptide (TPR) repeat protein
VRFAARGEGSGESADATRGILAGTIHRKKANYYKMGRKRKVANRKVDARAELKVADDDQRLRNIVSGDGRSSRSERLRTVVICALLVLAVAAVFGKSVFYDFVMYDDNVYVSENPIVLRGLTLQGIAWAWTANAGFMTYPITWLSYMLDAQLFGTKPWGFHLTNVLLHAATTVVLFLTLRRMTGDLWASAMVALLFAIHPLRAESVAWIGERKGPLSGLLSLLAVSAYAAYAARPFSVWRYSLVALLYALAFLAKPAIVALPLLLLLLDFWPLRRWQGMRPAKASPDGAKTGGVSASQLLIEKLPLLLLGIIGAVVTAQRQTGNVVPLAKLSLAMRVANSLISCAVYLGQFVWPANLAVVYPRPATVLGWHLALAVLILGIVSLVAVLIGRREPAVLFGWLWYLVNLLPVIGLVAIGDHLRADRYTYLPYIGLCIAAVWGMRWVLRRIRVNSLARRWCVGAACAVLIGGLMACTWRQTSFWHDTESMWRRALDCTSRNAVAHDGLGTVLLGRGDTDRAITEFKAAIEIAPSYALAHNNLGNAVARTIGPSEAIAEYEEALRINPEYAEAYYNLGVANAGLKHYDKAIDEFRTALQYKPDYADAHVNLGIALFRTGKTDDAIAEYRKALGTMPDRPEAHYNLGNALTARGQFDEAIAEYGKVIAIRPDHAATHYQLGKALAGSGRLEAARAEFRRTLQLDPNHAEARRELDAAEQARKP